MKPRISVAALRYPLAIFTLCLVLVVMHWPDENLFQQIEKKVYDLRLRVRAPMRPPQDVIIADIDEKSLKTYGRWPWPRRIMADLVRTLHKAHVRAIGFDMVFSENDAAENLSTLKELSAFVAQGRPPLANWKKGRERDLLAVYYERLDQKFGALAGQRSSDEELATALALGTPITLGIIFDMEEQSPEETAAKKELLQSSVLCQTSGNAGRYVTNFRGAVTNLATFHQANIGYGSFNFFPDGDGTSRRTNAIVRYGYSLYPSLAIATAGKALGAVPSCIVGATGLEAIAIGDHRIPIDLHGRMVIDYYGDSHLFPYYSIQDILEGKISASALRDRIVLVGTSTPGLFDLRVTPISRAIPGVEIHATAIQNILDNRHMERRQLYGLLDALIVAGLGLCCLIVLPRLDAVKGAIFAGTLAFGYILIDWFIFFRNGHWHFLFFPVLCVGVLYGVITLMNYLRSEGVARAERKKRTQLKSAFQHYVSASLVDQIMKQPERLKLGGERRELTVLFSDVRGFTTLSERLTPEALVDLLNEYLTPMTDVILSHQGMLDKYIGDAIMAVFGAPLPIPQHAASACQAALHMLDKLKELHDRWRAQNIPPLEVGMGINTGDMSIGNMGSEMRFDYTVMGDHVNLGSRLEGVNKVFGTRVLVSEHTKSKAGNGFLFREVDRLQVKGRNNAVTIFELIGTHSSAPPYARELIDRFHVALASYRTQDWEKAQREFEAVLAFHPEDGPTKTFLERIGFFRLRPPEADWNGVFQMKTK